MSIPANLTSVIVRGTFINPEGEPSIGTVSFQPSSWLNNSGANVSIPNSVVTKTLGTAGDFSATLPVTDDPDVSPSGWVYTVREVVDGQARNYDIELPGTATPGGTIYLADLVPSMPAGPEYYSLASSLVMGTVTTLAAGSAATATITGTAPSQALNLGIPTGPQGSAATITVGTVTSLAYGGTAAVTNSGTSGSAVLNFALVTGAPGDLSPAGVAAAGSAISAAGSASASAGSAATSASAAAASAGSAATSATAAAASAGTAASYLGAMSVLVSQYYA